MNKIDFNVYLDLCDQTVKHYKSDLDEDAKLINQGKECLFFVYESGSHAIVLFNFESYPAFDQRVPFLFGTANRDHILNETGSILECESVKNAPLKFYFDGKQMFRLGDIQEATTIVADYKRKMSAIFKKYNGYKAA